MIIYEKLIYHEFDGLLFEQKLDLEKGKYHQKENGYLISIIKPISYEYQYL